MTSTPTAHREVVAAEVRAWMGRRRATQTDLAKALDKSQAYISRRLSGEVPFDIDDLYRLAAFFEIEVTALLGPTRANLPDKGRLVSSGALSLKPLAA